MSLFNFLIQHMWIKENTLSKRINDIKSTLESLMTKDFQIDRISLCHANHNSSSVEFIFEIITLSSFDHVLFQYFKEVFTSKLSSPIVKTLFKGMRYSIKKLDIRNHKIIESSEFSNEVKWDYISIASECNYDLLTHILFNFLVKSKLIESIEEIQLEFTDSINSELLFKLISGYKSKDQSFVLSFMPISSYLWVYNDIATLWMSRISKYKWLNFKQINVIETHTKINSKYKCW